MRCFKLVKLMSQKVLQLVFEPSNSGCRDELYPRGSSSPKCNKNGIHLDEGKTPQKSMSLSKSPFKYQIESNVLTVSAHIQAYCLSFGRGTHLGHLFCPKIEALVVAPECSLCWLSSFQAMLLAQWGHSCSHFCHHRRISPAQSLPLNRSVQHVLCCLWSLSQGVMFLEIFSEILCVSSSLLFVAGSLLLSCCFTDREELFSAQAVYKDSPERTL